MSNPFLEGKKQRVKIATEIVKANNNQSRQRILALMELNLGLSKQKALEYLRLMVDLGYIEIKDGVVLLKGK